MTIRAETILQTVATFGNVSILENFTEDQQKMMFSVRVVEGVASLNFNVEILALYPMQFHDTETIRFVNTNLLEYDHVNGDGSICVHTLHSTQLSQKLHLDFESLRHWIRKYYIAGEKDSHYEHIVVNPKSINDTETVFLFTDVDYSFTANEFGFFNYSYLATGLKQGEKIITNLIQSFQTKQNNNTSCKWSKAYRKAEKQEGLFCFLKTPPVKNRRFAIENWKELEPFVHQGFIQFLFSTHQNLISREQKPSYIPLLLGYSINEREVYWQAVMIATESLPVTKNKVLNSHRYLGQFQDQEMFWCQTRNCSYEYYFGRGKLHDQITTAKVLVIGLGAIGSIVAKSIVRGGVRDITLIDYDVKEPENVCRSEYSFHTGICNKAVELHGELVQVSPFVQVHHSEVLMDVVKLWSNHQNIAKPFKDLFSKYNLIFDCTTDSDVASLLDRIDITSQVYCLSITNEAKELICAVKPNLYSWLAGIFEKLNTSSSQELYQPTGCWSPTFRAGYTDIAVMVQWAIKQINTSFVRGKPVRNFVISAADCENFFEPKLIQF